MAQHFFLGKPGGGKTYRALREIVEELIYGIRVIVTNASLKLPELAAYLAEKYPDKEIDLNDRIRILTEEQARRFYLYRQYGCDFLEPTEEETKKGARVAYVFRTKDTPAGVDLPEHRPVMYVIDEVHTFFDARNWQATGPHVTHYNSQHRKLGDEVFFITQFLDLVDKRLRGFSQSFILVRNHKLERLFLFRGPPYHSAKTYQSPPTGFGAVACHEEWFTFDLALGACYDTTAGMGIPGRSKPQERGVKGLHPAWAVVAFVAAVALLYFLPDIVSSYALRLMDSGAEVVAGAMPGGQGVPAPAPQLRGAPGAIPEAVAAVASPSLLAPPAPPVQVTGYVASGRRATVWLTDGTVLTEADLEEIDRRYVKTRDGTRYFIAKPRSSQGAPVVPAVVTQSPVPAVEPQPRSEGSWTRGTDGVARLN